MLRPIEPKYQGRIISDWIADLYEPPPKYDAAVKALREMKQAALPIIENRILEGQENTFLNSIYFKSPMGRRYSRSFLWEADFQALRVIGKDSIPVLDKLLDSWDGSRPAVKLLAELDALEVLDAHCTNLEFTSIKMMICEALEEVTQRKEFATTILLRLTSDQEADVRIRAIRALGEVQAEPPKVIPRLCAILEDGDPRTQSAVISSMIQYGTNAVSAVPTLVRISQRGNDELAKEAVDAIARIAPQQKP